MILNLGLISVGLSDATMSMVELSIGFLMCKSREIALSFLLYSFCSCLVGLVYNLPASVSASLSLVFSVLFLVPLYMTYVLWCAFFLVLLILFFLAYQKKRKGINFHGCQSKK